MEIKAVVDTAAEVTTISDRFYKSMKYQPKPIRKTLLLAAGREMKLHGYVIGPVTLKIGRKRYVANELHVAPIQHDMLLGFDILYEKGSAILNMGERTLIFDGQCLDMGYSDANTNNSTSPIISRVTVAKRRVVPPNSVAMVKCDVHTDMHDYIIEGHEGGKVIVPRTLDNKTAPMISVMNMTDRFTVLKKGADIAKAYTVNEIITEELKNTYGDEDENVFHTLPSYMEDM